MGWRWHRKQLLNKKRIFNIFAINSQAQHQADEHRRLRSGEQHLHRPLHETRLAVHHRTRFYHFPQPQLDTARRQTFDSVAVHYRAGVRH